MATGLKIPTPLPVQMAMDKGRFKEVYLSIKPDSKNSNFSLEMSESKDSWRPKATYQVRRVLSELKFQDSGLWALTLVTTETEVTFLFKNEADALGYHTFICEKSEVYAENKAISQLDDEMMKIWPFPGGSFF
jgi:hypothetical protein